MRIFEPQLHTGRVANTVHIENVSEPQLHTGRVANTVHIENVSEPQLHTGREQPAPSIENNFTRKVATTGNRTEVYCYKKEKESVLYIQFGKFLLR